MRTVWVVVAALFTCTFYVWSFFPLQTLAHSPVAHVHDDAFAIVRNRTEAHFREQADAVIAGTYQPRREDYRSKPEWNWYWSEIFHSCATMLRIGRFGDGGKYICNLHRLTNECLVYAFGVGDDVSFEGDLNDAVKLLNENRGCEVHFYDATLLNLKQAKVASDARAKWPHFTFTYAAICAEPGELTFSGKIVPCRTMKSILEENGHTGRRVHVLKMDIEGSEWSIIEGWWADKHCHFPNVEQMQIEFHNPTPSLLKRTIGYMEDCGYVLVMKDPNLLARYCMEYVFARKDILLQ